MKEKAKSQLCLRIPENLHIMLKKLAADTGLSCNEIVCQFLQHLKARPLAERRRLNASIFREFKIAEKNAELSE